LRRLDDHKKQRDNEKGSPEIQASRRCEIGAEHKHRAMREIHYVAKAERDGKSGRSEARREASASAFAS
jgi:hypothetical protein